MTVSDVFAAPSMAAEVPAAPVVAPERARVRERVSARGSILQRVTDAAKQAWADLRAAWWLPASIPTVARAWRERIPDKNRVPAESDVLWWGWVVYNHTVGLAVPVAVTALVGVLTPAIWVARHPARVGLAVLILIPFVATVLAL